LRAADLIGQLGDPHYLRKANALYYEFEEIGLNRQLGYESPSVRSPLLGRTRMGGCGSSCNRRRPRRKACSAQQRRRRSSGYGASSTR